MCINDFVHRLRANEKIEFLDSVDGCFAFIEKVDEKIYGARKLDFNHFVYKTASYHFATCFCCGSKYYRHERLCVRIVNKITGDSRVIFEKGKFKVIY